MTRSTGIKAGVAVTVLFVLVLIFVVFCVSQERSARNRDFVFYEVRQPTLAQKLFTRSVDEKTLRSQMVGAWEMRASRPWGKPYKYWKPGCRRYKIRTPTQWAIITYGKDTNIIYSAGGTYTLENGVYTEYIEHATGGMTNAIGARPEFNIRIEDDKYYQMGLGDEPFIEEMWERLSTPLPYPDFPDDENKK